MWTKKGTKKKTFKKEVHQKNVNMKMQWTQFPNLLA